MVAYYFMSFLHTLMAPFLAAWMALDPHLDQNPYLTALMAYMSTLNKFLPITDAFIPTILAWFIIAQPLTTWQFILKLYNAIRGAGVK